MSEYNPRTHPPREQKRYRDHQRGCRGPDSCAARTPPTFPGVHYWRETDGPHRIQGHRGTGQSSIRRHPRTRLARPSCAAYLLPSSFHLGLLRGSIRVCGIPSLGLCRDRRLPSEWLCNNTLRLVPWTYCSRKPESHLSHRSTDPSLRNKFPWVLSRRRGRLCWSIRTACRRRDMLASRPR